MMNTNGRLHGGAARLLLVVLTLVIAGATARAQFFNRMRKDEHAPKEPPSEVVQKVSIDQNLNAQLPLELPFRDETGRGVKLGEYFGAKPVLLVLAYYECPQLCTQVLNGLAKALKVVKFDPGKDFEIVVVSIDPKETPGMAAEKKADLLRRYGRPDTAAGWHFLTGPQPSIDRLTEAVGFSYSYDQERNQYAHAAGMVILTPQGKISRYFFGLEYQPRDVRLGLIESSGGKIGNLVDQVLLYCFHYDPVVGRYSAMTLNILRLAAVATTVGLILLIVLLRRRETPQPGPLGAA
jgi:protein SCO1